MKCSILLLIFCVYRCFAGEQCEDGYCGNTVITSDNFTIVGYDEKRHHGNLVSVHELSTLKDNKDNYNFISIGDIDKFTFEANATHDLHIGLFSSQSTSSPWYEILIGGWLNQKSLIRKNQVTDCVTSLTPEVVQWQKPNNMWVKFKNGIIAAGFQGEDALISFKDENPIPKINFVGFHTGYGADGKWKINIPTENQVEKNC